MDDDVDKSIKKIREILHTRKKPTMHEILVLLNKELSPITTCYIRCLTKQYKKIHSPDDERKYFSKFITRIYFPKENYCFLCSRKCAAEIPVIKTIIEGKFQECVIDLIYQDECEEFHGGQIVICKTDIESILLPSPQPNQRLILTDFVPNY